MQIDRRVSRGLNALCATAALSAVVVIGGIALVHRWTERPSRVPERIPGLSEARHRATLAERRGDEAEAERAYRLAFGMKPTSDDLRVGYARACLALGKRQEARRLLQPLVERSLARREPVLGGSDTLASYGDLLMEAGELRAAERVYRLAANRFSGQSALGGGVTPIPTDLSSPIAKLGPRRLAAWASLEGSWSARGADLADAAERHLQQAIAWDPGFWEAWKDLARIRFREGREAEGAAAFARAKRLTRPGEPAWIDLAGLEFDFGVPSEARAMFAQAERSMAPADAIGWLALAHLYRSNHLGQKDEMDRRAWRAAGPNDAEAWRQLASEYAGTDRVRAMTAARRAKALTKSTEVVAYGTLATVFGQLGEKAEEKTMLLAAMPHADRAQQDWLWSSVKRLDNPTAPVLGGSPGWIGPGS